MSMEIGERATTSPRAPQRPRAPRGAARVRDDRGATNLPELLTVAVTSIVVLGAILIALVTMDSVSARTAERSDALRAQNLALRTISKDVRGAFAVAPLDPAAPGAATDGIALLVQSGTTGAARDPRVWVRYSCSVSGGRRSCVRTVYAAEVAGSDGCVAGSSGPCSEVALPTMRVAAGRFGPDEAPLSQDTVLDDLAVGTGAAKVFSLGWPSDSGSGTCADASCTTWGAPADYSDARLDPRGFYRRGPGDSRPPVVRVTLQSLPKKAAKPHAITTSLSPRGCVDPAAPATTGNQFEC